MNMKKPMIYLLRYFFNWIGYLLGKFFTKILNQIEVSGKENIPSENKGICFFPNHRTIVDSWWIMIAMMNISRMMLYQKRLPVNTADSKNFFSHPILKHFFKLMKCIPVSRNTNNLEAMNKQVLEYVKISKNHNMLIFFEGTRSRNREIGKCKYGPAKLVLLEADHIKFIPVFLDGVEKIMPIKEGKIFTRLHLFHSAKIIFGPEINFSDILEQEIDEFKKIQLIQERIRNSVLILNT